MHLIIKSSQLRIPLHQVHENNQQSEIDTRNQSKVRKNIKLQSHHFASLLLQQPPFKLPFSGLSLMPEYSPVNDTPTVLTLSIMRCHLQKYMYLQYRIQVDVLLNTAKMWGIFIQNKSYSEKRLILKIPSNSIPLKIDMYSFTMPVCWTKNILSFE